jgi:hypothetical protein
MTSIISPHTDRSFALVIGPLSLFVEECLIYIYIYIFNGCSNPQSGRTVKYLTVCGRSATNRPGEALDPLSNTHHVALKLILASEMDDKT